MKIFTYNRDYNAINFKLISDNPDEILYFDLETTGLSAKNSDLYMIGYGHTSKEGFKITLLFNDDGCSEPSMLEHFANILQKHAVLVSYNGNTFDIPYIKEKFRQFHIDYDMSAIESCDIYKILKKYKKQLHLSSMRQSDLEQLMHIQREAFISGGDLIPVYKRYLSEGNDYDLTELVRHNLDDMDGLVRITDALAIHKLYNGSFRVNSANVEDDWLYIQLSVPNSLPFRMNYGYDNIYVNGLGNEVHIKLPVENGTMKYFFSDYKNYYYLPLEDMAIHKSMAAYVDSEHKRKATKETAFVKKEGAFIRCPADIGLNRFSYMSGDKEKYIAVDDNLLSNTELLNTYVHILLK